jgi:hypothetical protein
VHIPLCQGFRRRRLDVFGCVKIGASDLPVDYVAAFIFQFFYGIENASDSGKRDQGKPVCASIGGVLIIAHL